MRYFLAPAADGTGQWTIFEGESAEKGGTVILELPGIISREIAEKTRIALTRAKAQGRREVADEIAGTARRLRLAPE